MFSKTSKRISLNPIDNRQYEGDTTPIMTDYIPPTTPTTPTTPNAPRSIHNGHQGHRGNGGYSNGGGGGGGGRTMKSAPIQLPGNSGSSAHSGTSYSSGGRTRGQPPTSPRYDGFGQSGSGGGQGGGNGGGNGARRNNTYHASSNQHHLQHQQQRHNTTRHGGGDRPRQQQQQQQMTYHSSRSQPDLHSGYQPTPQMYSPTSPSFHNQYPPPSPGSPLPPYVERPVMTPPPPSYSPSSRDVGGGGSGRGVPARSVSNDPELAMYESSAYYTNRNRKQQQQQQLMQQRRRQQQEQEEKGECCSCLKDIGEFCPCLCFCCLFGAVAV
ncbi:hypothetical protein BC939DRAFT_457001 [Gamsiella multidivaricata]|uniref:uncharacterized protein n=1 Tax=Gamsiella multidivaricata TaxID=101098 RepID=UPI0022212017|nr:uncharacterized protein BC939DRAFT_457001 [Gamsiella multidivaricata]KAI7820810.1 hypothetical protein BC939DRAFT_457001 [Gamsiella multidivaricata]